MNPFGFLKKRVTPEEIVWCYRHFLGREPEGEAAISPHLTHKTFRELADVFAASEEAVKFREAGALVVHNRRPSTYVAPPIPTSLVEVNDPSTLQPMGQIDTVAKIEQLERCVKRMLPAWEQQPVRMDVARTLVPQLSAILTRHGAPTHIAGLVVELGCGAKPPLCELFEGATSGAAYDFSQALLAAAQARANASNQANVAFRQLSADPLDAIPSCSFLFSVAALQHFPPPLIAATVRKGLGALMPGGLAVIQLLTHIDGYAFKLVEWLEAAPNEVLQYHALPIPRVAEIIAGQGCELVAVEGEQVEAGSHSCILVIRKMR